MRDAVLAPSRVTRGARLRSLLADACHVLLSTSMWLGSTMLVALGILFAFAIVAAGGEPAIFFAHLDNLANHYLAASPDRRAEFDAQLLALLGTILLLLLLARIPAFAVRMRRDLISEVRQ